MTLLTLFPIPLTRATRRRGSDLAHLFPAIPIRRNLFPTIHIRSFALTRFPLLENINLPFIDRVSLQQPSRGSDGNSRWTILRACFSSFSGVVNFRMEASPSTYTIDLLFHDPLAPYLPIQPPIISPPHSLSFPLPPPSASSPNTLLFPFPLPPLFLFNPIPTSQNKKQTHPFPNPIIKFFNPSLCGKHATFHQLVVRLSFGPVLVPSAYLIIWLPELVGTSSGSSARRPTMVILATRCAGVVERARVRGWLGDGQDRGRRRRKDIVEVWGDGG